MSVAETESFSASAQEMHCVQSNITSRIRRLEAHLGQPVFERGRGGARITEFGQLLRQHAEDLLPRFDAAERDLLDAAGISAPLRLGAMETTAAARLPSILKALKQLCPTAPISLRTGPTGELLSLLWNRKIDTAFVASPIDENRFHSVPAFREHLVLARSAANNQTGPLLAFRSGCSYRATAESWLRSDGKSDTEIIEMGTFEGILGCVEAGMGFAIAPESAIRTYHGVGSLNLTALPAPYASVETHLTWRIDHKPSHAHQALCHLVGENLAESS